VTPDQPGSAIVRASWLATGVFTVAATAAAAATDQLARPVAVLDCVLFVLGVVTFLVAFARAVSRSRSEVVEVLGVYFLGGGVAPPDVRRHLLGAFGVQVVVAVATASIRPYTAVAFGILVPMLGLGLAGLWGATHGRFPARHAVSPPSDRADWPTA
jgi:hypothetical protein